MNGNLNDVLKNRVIANRKDIERFLGYAHRDIPPIIARKISEELDTFSDYLEVEWEYRRFEKDGKQFADIIYTVGDAIEVLIAQYTSSSEAIRGMIVDKMAIVALDEMKKLISQDIFQKHDLHILAEYYPGSKDIPLSLQKEILDSMKNIRTVSINEYYQLKPLKTVALRVELGKNPTRIDRCQDCENPCDGKELSPPEAYEYLLDKANRQTRKHYLDEGLSLDLFQDNIQDIYIWGNHYEKKYGRKGIEKEHFGWVNRILDMKVIKLGRLQFERLEPPQVPDLHALLPQNDCLFVNVHIRAGEKLNPDLCEISYKKAASYYRKKESSCRQIIFLCDSWLLNPVLSRLLPADSNIVAFQKKYTILSEDPLNRQMEERVFGFVTEDADQYPENTILQRLLKEKRKKGIPLGTALGMFRY